MDTGDACPAGAQRTAAPLSPSSFRQQQQLQQHHHHHHDTGSVPSFLPSSPSPHNLRRQYQAMSQRGSARQPRGDEEDAMELPRMRMEEEDQQRAPVQDEEAVGSHQHQHVTAPMVGGGRAAGTGEGWAAMEEESQTLYRQLTGSLSRQLAYLQHERLGMLREQQTLELKRHNFEEVRKQMSSVLQLQENRVKLNVGGVKFTTSLDTLLMHPDTMLGSMFSGKYRLEKDEKGYFFIDRDGTHFRYILNFLRTGSLLVPDDPLIRKELLIEAEFYQIPALIDLLGNPGGSGEARFSKELCHKNLVLDTTCTTVTVATKGTCRVLVDTPSVHSGKSYYEFRLDKLQNPNCIALGVTRTTSNLSTYVGSTKDGWSVIVMNRENLKKWNSPTCEEYGRGAIFREGDTVGLLLDYSGERGVLSFYVNGVCQGEAFRSLPPHLFVAISLHSKGDQVSIVPCAKLPEEMMDA